MKTYTSGELAKRVGVNGETIRYYERIGLLSPSDRRMSGYRIFTDKDVGRLSFIRSAKSLGFTLREISGLLRLLDDDQTKCVDMKELATKKVAEIERKITDLSQMQMRLQQLLDRDCSNSIHPRACRSGPAVSNLYTYS